MEQAVLDGHGVDKVRGVENERAQKNRHRYGYHVLGYGMICGRLRGIDELKAGYTVALCSVADTEIDKAQERAEGNAEYCAGGSPRICYAESLIKRRDLFAEHCSGSRTCGNGAVIGALAVGHDELCKNKSDNKLAESLDDLRYGGRDHVAQTLVISSVSRDIAAEEYRRGDGYHRGQVSYIRDERGIWNGDNDHEQRARGSDEKEYLARCF